MGTLLLDLAMGLGLLIFTLGFCLATLHQLSHTLTRQAQFTRALIQAQNQLQPALDSPGPGTILISAPVDATHTLEILQ